MNKKFKRLLGAVASLSMAVALLPSLPISAATTVIPKANYEIAIDDDAYEGTLFFADGKYGYNLYTDFACTNVYTGQGGDWSVHGSTLILNGLDIIDEYYGLKIMSTATIETKAGSVNNISAKVPLSTYCFDKSEREEYPYINAMYSSDPDEKRLTFTGDGELNLYADSVGLLSPGQLTVNDGTINIHSGFIAIEARDFTQNGGCIKASVYSNNGMGVYTQSPVSPGSVEINGGLLDITLNAISSEYNPPYNMMRGIESTSFVINGGKALINISNRLNRYLYMYGIQVGNIVYPKDSFLLVNGGELTINCDYSEAGSIGIKDIACTDYTGNRYIQSQYNGGTVYISADKCFDSDYYDFKGGEITYVSTDDGCFNHFVSHEPNLLFGMKAYTKDSSGYNSLVSYDSTSGMFVTQDGRIAKNVQIKSTNPNPPIIIDQSVGGRYVDNDTDTLFVTMKDSCSLFLTYSWEKDGKVIDNATSNSLCLNNISEETEGTYKCIVNDLNGNYTESDEMKVIVDRPLTITKVSGEGTYSMDSTYKLIARAEGGSGNYFYYWECYRDGIKETAWYDTTNELEYSMKAINSFNDDKSNYSHIMRCYVRDDEGRTSMTEFAVNCDGDTIPEVPVALSLVTTESKEYRYDEHVELEVTRVLGGTAPYTYQWMKDGDVLEGENDAKLNFIASRTTAGTYTCTVTDANGAFATSSDIVIGTVSPLYVTLQSGDIECEENTEAMLHVQAIGGNAPYTYKWIKDGEVINNSTDCDLTFVVTDETVGTYSCEISDRNGKAVIANDMVVSKTAPVEDANVNVVAETRVISKKSSNAIGQQVTIKNGGEVEVDLSKVEVRYYFSADSVDGAFYRTALASGNFNNSTAVDLTDVTGEVVKMSNSTETADSYVKLTYAVDGSLSSSDNFIQAVFYIMAPTDSTSYDPTNDYSFINQDVAVFYDGVLISGTIPQ